MKRWAVFEIVQYYPSGGMDDFVGAFETREEAQLYINRSFRSEYLTIEDMAELLGGESPHIPTEEEFQERVAERRRRAREPSLVAERMRHHLGSFNLSPKGLSDE